MDPEQVKASNEHAQKTPEIEHETQEKTLEVSPHNPPTNPEADESIQTKSPAIQTMEASPGYDPNRIPASIFSSRAGSPTDWSATSNESLFSIHMGNNSFSRDYAILFGKSGEFPKLEDWNTSPQSGPFMMPGELPRIDEWDNSPQSKPKSKDFGSLPPVMEENGGLSRQDEDVSPKFVSGQTTDCHVNDNPITTDQARDVSAAKKLPVPETNYSSLSNPVSLPRFSDVSVQSGSSFAFPVLGSHDSGKSELMRVVPEKPEKTEKIEQPEAETQAQVSQETPVSIAGTRWFPCFSCWPRFC